MRYRFILFLTFMLAITLVLTACDGDEDESAEEVDATESSESDGEESSGSEDDSNSEASSDSEGDQVLVFARGGDSESLDYASTTDGESSRVTKQVYESLLEFEKDSFEVKPGLAHDWEVSDDGLTYTFFLEEDVTFHDGTDFNAEAVKTNFERWADPNHEFAFADDGYVYSMYGTMFGGFKGDDGHVIKEINVVDDHEIEFVLNQPLGFSCKIWE